jgi:dTDP-4-amino-4,6-dideoxygalactose transaminase
MARETLSLPMYAELTEGQRARVVERLRSVVARGLS